MKRVLRSKKKKLALTIVYKKTDEWYIEWQRVTTNDKEWQRVVKRMTTNDSEWYNEWQRMATSDNEWQQVVQQVTKSENEWQRLAMSEASESSGTANENGAVHSKEWMIAIISITKRDALLLQGMDGCN